MEDGNYAHQEFEPIEPAFESTVTVDRTEGAVRQDWRVYALDRTVAIVPISHEQDVTKLAAMMARQGLTVENLRPLNRGLSRQCFADYDRPIEDES